MQVAQTSAPTSSTWQMQTGVGEGVGSGNVSEGDPKIVDGVAGITVDELGGVIAEDFSTEGVTAGEGVGPVVGVKSVGGTVAVGGW